jgi:ribulose-phosphate 3-epimerase
MIDIIPGIFEAEWSTIEAKVKLVAGQVPWVQVDFADGTLVPTVSFLEIAKFSGLTRDYPKLSLEAHLMVDMPEKYIKPLSDAGFKRVIAHVECQDPRVFLEEAHYESVEVGMAIDAGTNLEQTEPFLEEIDFVLIMSVEAGASGQKLMPETLEKIKILRRNYPDLPIEADGGINDMTAKLVIDAGATRLVSTSFIFKDPALVSSAIRTLQSV